MTGKQFLDQLESMLKSLPVDERQDILSDYEEHIRAAIQHGKTEQKAIDALGNPKAIAKAIMAERYVDEASGTKRTSTLLRAVMATVSLGFFNLLVVLAPFIALVAVLISLYAASLALIVSPVMGIWMLATGYGWIVFFAMLVTEGIGILVLLASWSLTKLMKRWLIGYLKFNVRLAKGGV